jgi:hypothetical protein
MLTSLSGGMDGGITVGGDNEWWHPCWREIWMLASLYQRNIVGGIPVGGKYGWRHPRRKERWIVVFPTNEIWMETSLQEGKRMVASL